MSYDNSELLEVYLDASAALDKEEYAEVARGIVRWVREVASGPSAGYAASQDADVGLDDDGDYFTWTRDEVAGVLSGDEFDVAVAYYDVGTAGEMHHNPGKNVLFVAAPLPVIARLTGLTEEAASLLLASAKRKLLEARNRRPAPFVDHTRYTNWNAMMASAMLRAGAVLDDADARAHALATLELLRRESAEPDAVAHTAGGVTGLLDDQVQTAAAALDAYEATGVGEWLAWAERLMERVWSDYWDEASGGLFDTARGRSAGEGLLPARVKPVQDTPTPSANGVAGITLMRLHELTGEARWRKRAGALLSAFAGGAVELGLHGSALLLALDWYLNPTTHLVVIGDAGDETAEAMHRAALAGFAPRRVVQRLTPAEAAERRLPPALTGMLAAGSGTRGYGCTGNTCSLPAGTLEEWRRQVLGRREEPLRSG